MIMKPFPWKCGQCHQKQVIGTTLASYETDLDHDGRNYPLTMINFRVARCENCGNIILDDQANRELIDALRVAAGLLHPTTIRERREALGLTQKTLASQLRVSESTLSRWESGAQIQQRAMDLLLRGYFYVDEFRFFASQGAALPEPEKLGSWLGTFKSVESTA